MKRKCPSTAKHFHIAIKLFICPSKGCFQFYCLSSPLLFACVLQGWCLVVVMGRTLKPVNRGYRRFFLRNSNLLQHHRGEVPSFPVTPRANIPTANIFLRNVYSGLNHEYFRFEPCCPVVISQISCMGLFLLDKWASAANLSAGL